MRVAIVHDWLLGMRGGERCLEVIGSLFPQADIYTLFYDPNSVTAEINNHRVFVSSLQKLPSVKKYYRALLPFYFLGIREINKQLAAQDYDLVISISHCVAKNIVVPFKTYHLCYCLTPVRYFWDQYDAYFANSFFEPVIRKIIQRLRKWDVQAAERVDYFLGISEFVVQRIKRIYQRRAEVVYPPVITSWIKPRMEDDLGDYFLCVNALVPYKNTQVIIGAFNKLGYPLIVVGNGPEKKKLQEMAKSNIKFISNIDDVTLGNLYQGAKALIFAAKEDFGMTPVEAQAAGRPVICYATGGVLETVNFKEGEETGIGFSELSEECLIDAISEFFHRQEEFTVDNCVKQARKFSLENFQSDFLAVVEKAGLSFSKKATKVAKSV